MDGEVTWRSDGLSTIFNNAKVCGSREHAVNYKNENVPFDFVTLFLYKCAVSSSIAQDFFFKFDFAEESSFSYF